MKIRLNNIYFLIVANLIIIAVLIFILKPSWQIGGDGYGYYIYLRSLVFDRNFDFTNEYQQFDKLYGANMSANITSAGKASNLFSIGPGILWSPFFAAAYAVEKNWRLADRRHELEGFGPPYQIAIFFAALFYFIWGLALTYLSLKDLFNKKIAVAASSIIWLISPMIFYLIYEPSMSHVFSFFALSGLFYFCLKYKNNLNPKEYIVLGFWLGLAILVRWQNIMVIIFPLYILFSNRLMFFGNKIKSFLYFILTGLIVFLPQLLMWRYLFGKFVLIPQGHDFFNWSNPQFFNFLFSGYHGMFIWQPLLAICLLGLIFYFRWQKSLVFVLLLILFGQIYINSATVDWMGGRSFGARRMSDYIFIFAVGLAFILDYLKHKRKRFLNRFIYLILILGLGWNLLLMVSSAKGLLPLDKPITMGQLLNSQKETFLTLFKNLSPTPIGD